MIDERRDDDDDDDDDNDDDNDDYDYDYDASDVGVPTMLLFFHLYGSTRLCPCADNAVIFPSSSAHRRNE